MHRIVESPKALIAATLLLQLALVSWTFPISELLTENIQSHIDSAYHWYHLTMSVNVAKTGTMVGYDPYFNAGYPAGVATGVSSRLPALVAIVLNPWVSVTVVYKASSFFAAVIGPLFVAFAALRLRLSPVQAALATAFGLILWWTSMFRWFHTAGMVTFVMASYAAVWYLALVFHCLQKDATWKFVVGTGIAGALLFFYHPLFPIPVVIGTLVYYAISHRHIDLRTAFARVAAISGISLLLNAFWIYPFFYYQRAFESYVEQPYQRAVDVNLLWQWTLGANYGAKSFGIVAFGAVWACFALREPERRRVAWSLTITGLFLVCYAALTGNMPGLGATNPNRFAPTAYLMFTIPAAMGVASMLARLKVPSLGWSPSRVLCGAAVVLMAAGTIYCVNEVRREISYANIGHYGKRPPEIEPPGEYSRWIPQWIQRETTTAGRILFEIPIGRVYDDANIAGYYAYASNREFIGGPYAFYFFASFWDGWLFRRSITSIDTASFQAYMDLYNIGWIIVHSDVSKTYLESNPNVEFIAEFKKVRAYKVNRPLGFFLEGKGTVVDRGHNKLVLADLEGEVVTLKYHFVPGLQSEPRTTIVPVKMLDDPNPFISILNPPKQVLLRLP